MSKEKGWTRRQFLQASAATATAKMALARPSAFSSPFDTNDTVRLGLIGCGPQGVGDLFRCLQAPKTKAVALCDVHEDRLNQAVERIGGKLDTYEDFRRIIDRKDIDAVIVATPDHWHAIQALQAIRSGKDVYLEKPVGHTIQEGQELVKATRQHDRIVEVGLQQRSGTIFQKAVELVQSGKIGKVSRAHCINAWNVTPTGQGRSRPQGFELSHVARTGSQATVQSQSLPLELHLLLGLLGGNGGGLGGALA